MTDLDHKQLGKTLWSIADCLCTLDARIAAETEKLAAFKPHKQGLMQQLFPSPEVV
jgi:type I restriction enzyme, S subunit